MDKPTQRGKHIALGLDCEEQILAWIQQNAQEDILITRGKILGYYTSQLKIKCPRGWVNSFILQLSDEVIQPTRGPREEQRSQVPGAFPERIIQDLHEYVQGCVAELVFNLDEIGISDREFCKTDKVIVPATVLGETIHHDVSRNVKHVSVSACASAAGESLFPYSVTSENSPVVHEHIKKHDVRLGRDFALKSNQKPYFNAGFFLDYFSTMFLPLIDAPRDLTFFAKELAILLTAHCSVHVSDNVIHILTEARLRVITFAPHTTQVFQVLDLTLFGVPKRCPRNGLPFDENNATVKVIMNVYHDLRHTMI
jgi:hypothetical protein